MQKSMKLRGKIKLESDNMLSFHGEMFDGTPFSLNVDQFDVQLNEAFLPSKTTVDGFLFVVQEAEQGEVCYLTLPKPSITYGKHLSVKKHLLNSRHINIKDFNPQNPTSQNELETLE